MWDDMDVYTWAWRLLQKRCPIYFHQSDHLVCWIGHLHLVFVTGPSWVSVSAGSTVIHHFNPSFQSISITVSITSIRFHLWLSQIIPTATGWKLQWWLGDPNSSQYHWSKHLYGRYQRCGWDWCLFAELTWQVVFYDSLRQFCWIPNDLHQASLNVFSCWLCWYHQHTTVDTLVILNFQPQPFPISTPWQERQISTPNSCRKWAAWTKARGADVAPCGWDGGGGRWFWVGWSWDDLGVSTC